jgi:hypothetical protein
MRHRAGSANAAPDADVITRAAASCGIVERLRAGRGLSVLAAQRGMPAMLPSARGGITVRLICIVRRMIGGAWVQTHHYARRPFTFL